MSRTAIDPNQRFDQKYRVNPATGCFIWAGRFQNMGYGCFDPYGKPVLAHRWAYERTFGTIPAGLSLDHLCRNPQCVNPMHLEAVTHKENVLRGISPAAHNHKKTQCVHGHPFSKENTYVHGTRGSRRCRICTLESNRKSAPVHKSIKRNPTGLSYRTRVDWSRAPTVCCYGHQLSESGIYISPKGHPECRACRQERRIVDKSIGAVNRGKL